MSCKPSYHIGVVIEKSQPNDRIQIRLLNDSNHYIYPSLTIDERDSIQFGDTLKVEEATLKLIY
jgi:hypothetical protein